MKELAQILGGPHKADCFYVGITLLIIVRTDQSANDTGGP